MNILLHMCCSNCALSPVTLLRGEKSEFTGFWFNPNIHPHEEYNSRLDSLKKLSDEWNLKVLYEENYSPEEFFSMFNISPMDVTNKNGAMGLDSSDDSPVPPFPERCKSCYSLRLEKTAEQARERGFDAFSTTLLISPYQDFEEIVSTGKKLSEKYNILFHLKDYRPHFRDAMALSKELGLYRQKYCGCIFSREERNGKRKKEGTEAQRHKGTK